MDGVYKLYYSLDSEFPVDQTEQNADIESPYALGGLTNDLTYYLALTAKATNGGESDFSNEVSATPTANTVPSGKLNDTGITFGGSYPNGNNETCVGAEINSQDCRHGRDAQASAGTLNKIGGGNAGLKNGREKRRR